ncbi:MAG: PDZ domain-containing protein [Planctomycetes bacterium]|nr:PDZ domain-containing protein [Planctomycetota bacterium]
MAATPGYYRQPTIAGDTILFVCEDDLWSVPAAGGTARRLTVNPGSATFPALAPDGARVAFVGRDDGPAEVYVMEAEGSPPRRLTWLGATTQVVGWTPDGKEILFASDWRQPFRGLMHLHAVPADGGPTRALGHGPARAAACAPAGRGIVIGRNSGDPARWKRYRGGTAGTLWIDRKGDGAFAPLIRLAGNLASPMWLGDRIYFLSDHEGFGNLYSCTPTGRDLRRHTHHEDFFARFPATDGRRIVYHAGADLYLFDPASDAGSGSSRKVDIRLHSARADRSRKFVPATRYLENFDLHPKGHALAAVCRGAAFTLDLWEGAPRRFGASGTRLRLARWLPDGKRLVAVTDEGGEESLVLLTVDGTAEPRRIAGDFGRPIDLAPAPAGADRVALTNQRQEVIVVDLAAGAARAVERSDWGRVDGLGWSPDGRWLAYGFPDTRRTCRIHLFDSATAKAAPVPVTASAFRDVRPAFDPEGKFLYFISWRNFDPVYDSLQFELGFPRGAQPFLLTLRADTPSPFAAATRIPRAPGATATDDKDKESGKADAKAEAKGDPKTPATPAPPKVEIDLDGIADRVVAFPVPDGRYAEVRGAAGRALFTSFPIEGSLDQGWLPAGDPPAKTKLQAWDFEQSKVETVCEKMTDFGLSLDGKTLVLRVGGRLRVVPAAYKPDGKPGSDDAGRESGWLDLGRLRLAVTPHEEWRQMFREAWRLQRDQFWTPDMSGLDWSAVHDRYLPLVDRAGTRAEFSDLLWELQGELGTSHCYELGGDYRAEPGWHQGFLGADLELDRKSGAWRIARIPRGDSWDEKRAAPLAAPGLGVKPGDELVAVAGEAVGPERSPYELLVHQAGSEVQLLVRAGAAGAGKGKTAPAAAAAAPRLITVKTLRDEQGLRYRDWVEANRARVHAETDGRVGYVHVPDMGPLGYSEFHRYFATEVDRDGLIVDVRWNGGGHVSQLLLEKLARRRVGYCATRWSRPESYPSDAPMGPLVALTNEYAGSDGDIFSHSFKLFKLGPLVGKRTWGGVVGIWPRHSLVDGTWTTQPEFAFWFEDVGWSVENYGTEPDIEVEVRPQDWATGRDPQMEKGLAAMRKLLKERRPRVPELAGRPRLRPVPLPRG